MNKYSEIEIETAKNMLKKGLKWIGRNQSGRLSAHACKPSKVDTYWWSVGYSDCTCDYVPIFQSIHFGDKEPVSLESIVHPQILDDAEKRYLSAVIRPFRDRVSCICKTSYDGLCGEEYQHLYIVLHDCNYNTYLPTFKKGTMYKDMRLGHSYTLEELGL